MSQLLIIAIGNGACNIADSLQSQGLESAKFVFLDTDPDDLNNHPGVGDTVLLQGAEQERHAAINRLLSADVERVAIIACLGGRTGTYFTPLAALWNWHDHTDDEYYEEMVMDEVVHHRFRWYHGRRLKALREKHLQPFIEQLVEEARHGPMFDGAFLYRLELEKFRCIREYFSYSFIADRDGNFSFKPWMDICIRLLEHIVEEGRGISDEQSLHVNVRNVGDIVDDRLISFYMDAPLPSETKELEVDKAVYGREIYVRKMERLYYRIRLNKMQDWWEP